MNDFDVLTLEFGEDFNCNAAKNFGRYHCGDNLYLLQIET